MIASALPIGALRPMAAHKRVPTIKKSAVSLSQTRIAHPIQFVTYADNNTVVFQNKQPIAWIVQGVHHGQRDNQPYTCTYYDVAFIKKSRHTYYLESSPEFDTEQQARDFVVAHFKAEVMA